MFTMFNFTFLSVATVLLSALGVLSAPSSVSVTPPAGFTISSFGLDGTGCPPGSAYYLLSPDRTSINVTYSQYYAEVGPGIALDSNRKNCQLTFGINVPSGFQFGIANVVYRGYYELDPKVTAAQKAMYYFQSSVQQTTATTTHTGPVDGADYDYSVPFPLALTNYSPCGTTDILNIGTSVVASNKNNAGGSGYISTDGTDVQFTHTFQFVWQTC